MTSFGDFIVNFEHISQIFLVFLFIDLEKVHAIWKDA